MAKKKAVTKNTELDAKEFFAAIEQIEQEKGIPQTYMIEKITQALVRAYERDHAGVEDNVVVDADREKGTVRMFVKKDVVETVDNPGTEMSLEDARKVVLSYSAAPGTSEHQTGLCLDFTTTKMQGNLTEKFEEEPAFAWLSQNAYKFGFILRYPQSKVAITGYSYEPWHYRFVGREAATDIYYSGLSLEEYLIAVQN